MSKKAVASLIVALLGMINILASVFGFTPVDIADSDINAFVTVVFALGGLFSTAWHNFNITDATKAGQAVTDSIKAGKEV